MRRGENVSLRAEGPQSTLVQAPDISPNGQATLMNTGPQVPKRGRVGESQVTLSPNVCSSKLSILRLKGQYYCQGIGDQPDKCNGPYLPLSLGVESEFSRVGHDRARV